MVGGGLLVSQNEADQFTAHFMVPPGVNASSMAAEDIISLAVSGCQAAEEEDKPKIDEVYCRGLWKVEVAIADAFRSKKVDGENRGGRVFLAGDAAHQLSPVGGHGLNSGVGDVFDLAWKIAAVEKGWGGHGLLASYDQERKSVAFQNLGHVQQALGEIAMPIFTAHMKYGVDVLCGEGDESEKVRNEVGDLAATGHWFHDQNGNMLGVRYDSSDVLIADGEVGEPPKGTNELYVPTTWPGHRAPHVWMKRGDGTKGGVSTIDELSVTDFNIIDFSEDGKLSEPWIAGAKKLGVPLKSLRWHDEDNVRKIYERDLVLVRPDMYVAWRGKADEAQPVSAEVVESILNKVVGRKC
jgi:hypothetical protein